MTQLINLLPQCQQLIVHVPAASFPFLLAACGLGKHQSMVKAPTWVTHRRLLTPVFGSAQSGLSFHLGSEPEIEDSFLCKNMPFQ